MSDDAIIEVKNLSKAYRIWELPSARLKSPLLHTLARFFPNGSAPGRWLEKKASSGYRDFQALDNISFAVRRGESWGIIGRNGSGKSTLLQMIAGTLQPTTGSVTMRGRVAALLELGSGFNPDFTGRENVYLNGAIFGFSEKEMNLKFAGITEFADIGDFIDQPVKTYSSGMMIRLAFAVAICSTPDVLIVDEALSVGDVFFQQKCFQRIREILESGTSLLFVSHDTAAVQNLCAQAVLLDRGRMSFMGAPEEAVSRYYALFGTRTEAATQPRALVDSAQAQEKVDRETNLQLRDNLKAHDLLPAAKSRHGDRAVEIVSAYCEDEQGLPSLQIEMTKTAVLRVLLRARDATAEPSAGFNLYDRMNNLVFAAGTRQLGVIIAPMHAGEERLLTFSLTCDLQPGEYTFSLEASEPSVEGPNFGFLHDKHEGLGPLVVRFERDQTWPFYGIARLPLKISVSS